MKSKAFTLIELLVTISIIAILAAILFPVFSVAKEAAKKTTSLENLHQIHLSTVMYQNDYDDAGILNFSSTETAYFTWQDLIQPYAKSYAIVFDPLSANQNQTNGFDYWLSYGMLPEAAAVADGSYPNFTTRFTSWLQNYTPGGLAYDGVAGVGIGFNAWNGGNYNTNPGGVPSKGDSAIARPSEYVSVFTAGSWDGFHAVYGYSDGIGYCGAWGSGAESFFGFQPRYNGATGVCNVATRATDYGKGTALVMFSDGHTKAMGAGALLAPDPNGGTFLKYWWPNQ